MTTLPTTSSPPFHFLQGERFIVFVPTNEAIYNNFSKIPLTPSILSRFMMYYFVNVNESSLGDYPFPGTNSGGELVTFRSREGGKARLTLIDAGDKLQVRDAKGNTVDVVGVFPRIYNDGAAYVIDGILEPE